MGAESRGVWPWRGSRPPKGRLLGGGGGGAPHGREGRGFYFPPLRISSNSESSKESGNRSARGLGRPGSRRSASPIGEGAAGQGWPLAALARTGSKSTNHDLKSARAMASSVSFIRRFSSILASSVPRMWAMARCSGDWRQGNR